MVMGIDCNGSFLLLGSAGVPVGTLSLLLSGEEGSEILLVYDTLVCSSLGFSWLLHLGNLWSLLSNFTSLGQSTVLLAH